MLIEAMVAALVLLIGIVGLLTGFVGAQKLSLMSEQESTMGHVAQREIERLEGMPYADVALTAAPATSSNSQSPDHYVGAGSPETFEWNRTVGSSEPIDVDTVNGAVVPVQSWTEGDLSGSIYDFVTWTADTHCSPGCPASDDYKRLTVAITLNGVVAPSPVYVSSVVADPNASPAQGTYDGTAGNPITDGSTTCYNTAEAVTTSCESPIDSGNPNTYYLHDCSSSNASCSAPSASSTLHDTVGAASGLLCTATALTGLLGSLTTGCPTPDGMSANPPTGTSTTPLYQYSTDVGTAGYAGGRLLAPLCSNGSGCGTGSTADCNTATAWTSSLINVQNEMWLSAPVATNTTLTGAGGINLFTETQNATDAVVTFCIEIYSVPPSDGVAGSVADILGWPPTALGGAAYVAPTDPATGANWPTSPSNVAFTFNFASSGVTVAAGNRIGVRVWMLANVNTAIALIYDNPLYPSSIQLNSA